MAELIEIRAARQHVADHARRLESESVPLANSLGRVTASSIESPLDQPSYTKSLVDGYALRSEDLSHDGRWSGRLAVTGVIFAGDAPNDSPHATLGEHEAVKIMTGAPLPTGADCVVMREHVCETEGGIELAEGKAAKRGQHVLVKGAAIRRGDTLVPAGKRLRPIELGVLADANQSQVDVVRQVRVGLIQTGDELVPLGTKLTPGKIVNSNGLLLKSLVEQAGGAALDFGVAPDSRDGLSGVVQHGLKGTDILLLSGGVSQGDRDFVPEVLSGLGVEPVFHRVNLRPGKPLWFGVRSLEANARAELPRASADSPRCLVFGLPGNPVSGFVCFLLFVLPALRRLAGLSESAAERPCFDNGSRTLLEAFEVRGARPTYWPGVSSGAFGVRALPWLGSADPFKLVDADCLIYFPVGDRTYNKGDQVGILSIG